jgi:DNA-binding NtrC family response regulator
VSLAVANTTRAVLSERPSEAVTDRKKWDMADRSRVIDALEVNGWKKQDTAQYLGISRKVLWEKIRKYQIDEAEQARAH